MTCDKTGVFLAKHVQQVFYVSDIVRRTRHIVLPSKRRIVGVQNTVDVEFNQFDEIHPIITCPHLGLAANNKTPYLRTDQNEKMHVRSSQAVEVDMDVDVDMDVKKPSKMDDNSQQMMMVSNGGD